MRLWTIQTIEAWQRAERQGVLYADGRRVWKERRPAYQWLMSEMKKRILGYPGSYPLWAWHSPKPDLRHSRHLAPGQRGVRLTLEIPDSRVLLSDFRTWHHVLNGYYLGLTSDQDEAFDDRPFSQESDRQALLHSSWQRIFDFEKLNQSDWVGPITKIQATFEKFYLHEVLACDFFTAR